MVSFSLLTFTALAAAVSALVVPEESALDKRSSNFFKLDFDVVRNASLTKTRVHKIANENGTVTETLYNKDIFYLTYVYAGSNKQKIGVDIDTGSSDTWFVDSSAECIDNSCQYGTYTPLESTTSKKVNEVFFIVYGDGTYALGNYYTDDIGFASSDSSAVVKNLQFADATYNDAGLGILGIGFDTYNAEAVQDTGGVAYPNLPYVLKNQGIISKVAYSLFLDSPDAGLGSVVFGGKDLAKVDGDLVTLPITSHSELTVTLNSLSLGNQSADINTDMLLDSGTTIFYLPEAAFTQLVGSIPGVFYKNISGVGTYLVDCGAPVPDLTFEFSFNGITIPVPLNDTYSNYMTDAHNNYVGCGYEIGSGNILGDTFLRRAYVVYDLEGGEISLGHPKYTEESNIVPI